VLRVDDAGRQQDMAAAPAAPSVMTALAGVAAELRGNGLEKGLVAGIGQLVLCCWWEGTGWPREDARAVRADANSAKFGPRIGRAGRVGPDESHRWGAPQWSDGPVGLFQTRAD
jgi:hypothetical protein